LGSPSRSRSRSQGPRAQAQTSRRGEQSRGRREQGESGRAGGEPIGPVGHVPRIPPLFGSSGKIDPIPMGAPRGAEVGGEGKGRECRERRGGRGVLGGCRRTGGGWLEKKGRNSLRTRNGRNMCALPPVQPEGTLRTYPRSRLEQSPTDAENPPALSMHVRACSSDDLIGYTCSPGCRQPLSTLCASACACVLHEQRPSVACVRCCCATALCPCRGWVGLRGRVLRDFRRATPSRSGLKLSTLAARKCGLSIERRERSTACHY
jgi:hypothetical protein